MEDFLKNRINYYLGKDNSPAIALALAQNDIIINEFLKIGKELNEIRKVLVANYGEAALTKMDNDEE